MNGNEKTALYCFLKPISHDEGLAEKDRAYKEMINRSLGILCKLLALKSGE